MPTGPPPPSSARWPAPRPGRRGTRSRIRSAPLSAGTGPITCACGGSSAAASRSATAAGVPVTDAIRTAGGKPELGAVGQLAGGEAGRIPADERLDGGDTGVGTDDDRAARVAPARRRPSTGAAPPHRHAGRPGTAAPSRRAAARRRSRRQRSVRRRAWPPRVPGGPRTSASTRSPPLVRTAVPGKRPAELLGGSPGTDHDGPQRAAATVRAAPVAGRAPAPAAVRDRTARRCRERAGTGRAARRGAVAHAGQRGHVPAPGHLHQHRGAGLEGCAGGAPGKAGQPGGCGGRVAGLLDLVTGDHDSRRGRAQRAAVGGDLVRPAGFDKLLGFGRPREAAEQQRAVGQRGPQDEHVAGVRVGRARLVVQVVAVVPDGQQAEVGDRRVGGGARADDRSDRAALDRQPPAVPLGRPEVGRQRDVPARPERGGDARRRDGRDRGRPGQRRSRRGRPRPQSGSLRRAGPASLRRAAPTTPRAPGRRSPTAARNAVPARYVPRPGACGAAGRARWVERLRSRRGRGARARRGARRRRSCRPTGRRPRGTARQSPR